MLRLLQLLQNFLQKPDYSNAGRIYLACLAKLGKDASPRDLAPDSLGCAESVSEIIHTVFPEVPIITGTWTFWEYMKKNSRFQETFYPSMGCIIISPSGTSSKGAKNGHIGIFGDNEIIMSADSRNGLFLENWTLKSWKLYYQDKLGFPIYFFRVI